MYTINIQNAKKQFDQIIESCLKFNSVVGICSKSGNVVLISEDNYNCLVESFILLQHSDIFDDVSESINTSTSEFIKNPPWD